MDVLEEKENPFLKRKDLMLLVDHTGSATPKIDDLTNRLAEKFNAEPEKIEIVFIFSQKGVAKSKVKAKIWKEKVVKREKPKEKAEAIEEKTNETQTNKDVGTTES